MPKNGYDKDYSLSPTIDKEPFLKFVQQFKLRTEDEREFSKAIKQFKTDYEKSDPNKCKKLLDAIDQISNSPEDYLILKRFATNILINFGQSYSNSFQQEAVHYVYSGSEISKPIESQLNEVISSGEMIKEKESTKPEIITKGGGVNINEIDLEESDEPSIIYEESKSKSKSKKDEPSIIEELKDEEVVTKGKDPSPSPRPQGDQNQSGPTGCCTIM